MENVTEKNCKGCPVFENDTEEVKQNAIKNNICLKREMVGCEWKLDN